MMASRISLPHLYEIEIDLGERIVHPGERQVHRYVGSHLVNNETVLSLRLELAVRKDGLISFARKTIFLLEICSLIRTFAPKHQEQCPKG